VIGRALVATVCDGDPAALKELGGRFSSVVYPGDTITVDIWREDAGEIKFRARIAERNAVVFNNGHAVIA
jgi:acyl dehydratase